MADTKQKIAWDHTSWILAMINNTNVTRKADVRQPYHFHPLRKPPKKRDITVDSIDLLRTLIRK